MPVTQGSSVNGSFLEMENGASITLHLEATAPLL